jgi:hypothetical protein
MPNGEVCFYGNKQPQAFISLEVDRREDDYGNQLERKLQMN